MKLRLPATALGLALTNAAVLTLCFGLLLAVFTYLAGRFMTRHVAESVAAELQILEGEYDLAGLAGVQALIAQRLQIRSADHDRRYRLEDADGRLRIGNLPAWPAGAGAAGSDFRIPGLREAGDTRLLARWTRLPDGSRLLVGFDEIEIRSVQQALQRTALWSLGLALLLGLALGWLLTRGVLHPFGDIRGAALRILGGDLDHRIPLRGTGDEFDRLAQTLNQMLDRIALLLSSVRGATDNIAHDLRSPLTRLRTRLESQLLGLPAEAPLRAALEQGLGDLDQVLATFRALLRIASVESGVLRGEFRAVDLREVIRDAAEFLEPLAESRGQSLQLRVEAAQPLHGHRDLLFQAVLNVLDNALKYGPPGAPVSVHAWQSAQQQVMEVVDRGPGIPPDQRERVFERLYRLDAARHTPGLGLGLALVKAIIELHGGTIELADGEPGTRLRLSLPRPGPAASGG